MSSQQLICHFCGHHDPAATLGVRCPADGSVLVPSDEHDKSPADSILGRCIGGKYAIIGLIGSGAMGAVYKALQEPVGREVAVKVIRRGDSNRDEEARARFLREAKIAAQLSNPAAVTLFDYGAEKDGVLYMVMELIRGRTLADALAEGAFGPERIVPIATQVLYALSEAHERGLVHRDIKPANVMLVRGSWGEELAKVLDFGIAKAVDASDEVFKTQAGLVLGTPLYMAPEQAREREVDGRADLYSVGVMVYEALTGKLPFTGGNAFEVLLAHRDQPVPPFPADSRVPEALQQVVFRALAKNRDERFPTAAAMAQALMAALPAVSRPAEEPVSASSSSASPAPEASSSLSAPSATAGPAADSSQPLPAPSADSSTTGSSSSSATNAVQPEAPAPARAPMPATPPMSANPAPVPAKKSKTGLIIGIVVGVLLLLVAGTAVGGWFVLKKLRGTDGPLGRIAAMLPGGSSDKESLELIAAMADAEKAAKAASDRAADDSKPGAGNSEPGAAAPAAADGESDDGQAGEGQYDSARAAADTEPQAEPSADDAAPADDAAAAGKADEGTGSGDAVAAADDAQEAAPEITYVDKVLFEDLFKRANSAHVGAGWSEYLVRGKRGALSLKQGNGAWVIRSATLSCWLRGSPGPVEDIVLTAEKYPVEGTRIEFELRGELPAKPDAGAVVGWVSDADSLRDGLTPGAWIGASFAGKDGLIVAGTKSAPQPALPAVGFNPSRWVKHTVTVSKGVLSYQVGENPPVTLDMEPAVEPDATRHFFFGVRGYSSATHKIDVRNFRVVGKVKAE
ncbi:MAG: serine/threonine-protein kinase [Myxococcales bacterium]